MFVDGRGKSRVELRIKNEKKILEYLKKNEQTTIIECAVATGLSYATVKRAAKRLGLKEGWPK